MNAYDFDNTIFRGNSYRAFYAFCLIRFPYLILYSVFQLLCVVACALKIISKTAMLRGMGYFLIFLPNKQKQIKKFWDKNINRIEKWYLEQKKDDDVIVSASPRYEVEEGCKRLGVKCIASNVDVKTGKVENGEFIYSALKVPAWKNEFGDVVPDAFYSDSLSDLPMMRLAKRGYLVNLKKREITLICENGEEIKQA